jgi:hypothetical protein
VAEQNRGDRGRPGLAKGIESVAEFHGQVLGEAGVVLLKLTRYSIAESFEARRSEELGAVRPAAKVGGRGEAVVRFGSTRHDGGRSSDVPTRLGEGTSGDLRGG